MQNKTNTIIAVIVILIVLGLVAYWFVKQKKTGEVVPTQPPAGEVMPGPESQPLPPAPTATSEATSAVPSAPSEATPTNQ